MTEEELQSLDCKVVAAKDIMKQLRVLRVVQAIKGPIKVRVYDWNTNNDILTDDLAIFTFRAGLKAEIDRLEKELESL